MAKIRRNDEVIVITGKDKGKRGKITRVLENGRVVVAGINMVKRHTRANPQLGTAGGIIEKEASAARLQRGAGESRERQGRSRGLQGARGQDQGAGVPLLR